MMGSEHAKVPSVYTENYEKARMIDQVRADNYYAHTMIGDPIADRLSDDLADLGSGETHKLIMNAVRGDKETLRNGPATLRALFESCEEPPSWVDPSALVPGCQLFHRAGANVLVGMVAGTLIEGFSTYISKSFFLTGRLRDQGVRRLRQNNRHMLEIFFPGGLERHGDGWAYSVRIRIIHARIRRLLAESSEWDQDELGTPINSAHLGFAISAFSARLLQHLDRLGTNISKEERASFMLVWRYSGYLMGIPETILFQDEADALEIYRIGRICEPSTSLESIAMASSLINSAPLFIGHTQRNQRVATANYAFEICRALIGDELADELRMPASKQRAVLWKFRMANKFKKFMELFMPKRARESLNIMVFIEASMYDSVGISYKLPTTHLAEESREY